MSLRRVLLALASVALGVVLIALLIRIGKIDLRLTWHQVRTVNRIAFIRFVFLNGLLVYLSTVKWRTIDAALRHSSDSAPSRVTAFAITSGGMALGLVFPVQLGMTAARTGGTYFHGRALKRGTAGTLFEQSFDLFIVVLFTLASGATYFCRGGGVMWSAYAITLTVLALLAVGPSIRLIQRIASRAGKSGASQGYVGALRRYLSRLQHSDILSVSLARQLVILSVARFAVVVLMAGQTAEAIGARIPLWCLAAAIPFVVLACVIAITPGGLGVNELTYAAALKVFGTPFDVGAQWALSNRVLGVAACFLVTASAAAMVGVQRLTSVNK